MQQRVSFSDALGHGMVDKRIDILRQIGAGGSISQAARAVGVSYKAAWQALDTLTNLAGVPLVERAVGGVGGGGTQLTPAGVQLLSAADVMDEARRSVLERLDVATGSGTAAIARLSVRTSMRNQWPCVVRALEPAGAVVRIHLHGADASAQTLSVCSLVTRESAELLALQPGVPVLALCKATAVRVAAASTEALGLVNHWSGRVARMSRGGAQDEVSAELDSGVQMVGFAPSGSGLRARSKVVLAVDESAVVLAVVG